MDVTKLDRDWLGTPFLLQGFTVQTLDEIDQLAEYCEHVWVTHRVASISDTRSTTSKSRKKRRVAKIQNIASADQIAERQSIRSTSHVATMEIMEEIRLGKSLNSVHAKQTVKTCVDNIVTDPDTMMLLTMLRDKDNYTTEHSLNVCVLAIAFGRILGFNEAELNQIGICALLHDVGKMKIPPEILNKPGKLESKEWDVMQAHTTYGRDIITNANGIYSGAVDVAYSHHEKLDGTGYPRKIKSKNISYYSKIISVCDAYDAMTATRCYKAAFASTQSLKLLYENQETQFDSKLVGAFMEMIGLYPPGSIVELKNGCVGIVVSRNLKYQHLPRVLLVRDETKAPCSERLVNLMQIEKNQLDRSYLIKRDLVAGSYDVILQPYLDKGLAVAI